MPFLTGPLLPWLIIAVLVAAGGAGTAGYVRGRTDGRAALEAELARDAATRQEAEAKALSAAATAIAKIDVENRTIQNKTEVITREVPVYRDCVHDPRVLSLLNDALTAGGRVGAQGADQGELPRPDAGR